MNREDVAGGGGVRLATYEAGNPAGRAILFIHGIAQSHLCWARQFDSHLQDKFRLVAFDSRGHGASEQPLGAENYTSPDMWADDVAAIIEHKGLDKPVVVAWSYGGYIINDYLTKYGQDAIGAINYVDAGAAKTPEHAHLREGSRAVELMPKLVSDDLATFIDGARGFLRACFERAPDQDEFEIMLAYNMVLPARVWSAMLVDREMNYEDMFRTLSLPVLVTQGVEDAVVPKRVADYILRQIPGAKSSFYENIGHSPFWEDSERFNSELADFASSVRDTSAS